jgi:hypothetical protein
VDAVKLSSGNKTLSGWCINIWLPSSLFLRSPDIFLQGGRNRTSRDIKRAANLLMTPVSVAIKSICNITLAEREPGSWLSKDWIAKWRGVVAAVSTYNIRYIKVVYISIAVFLIIYNL